MKKTYIALLCLCGIWVKSLVAQSYQQFYQAYDQYRQTAIEDRRFKHADIAPLIRRLPAPFQVSEAGRSVEGREIYLVRLGDGPVKVLLWSQMHGDEPTATMALMDIFNFFKSSGDAFDDYRRRVLRHLTLYFIPMLNPDGAERFQRRNALGIDLNRDALRLTSPEAGLLKRVRDETDADWGFNLHDQSKYYAVGDQPNHASISFLAPAYNEEKDINTVRGNAMKLIAGMNEILQQYIPNQVAKYSDTFEPRAFGDNIQKWGTSTILIESGGMPGDPEKQFLRRLHFVTLLSAFDDIAGGGYNRHSLEVYKEIPYNDYGAFEDLILREVMVQRDNQWYTVDIAFKRQEIGYNDAKDYYYRGTITDIGDLSTSYAYEELDGAGYRAVPGKIYYEILGDVQDLKSLDLPRLVEQGYTDFFIADWPVDNHYHTLPIRLLREFNPNRRQVQIGGNPSLLLQKNGITHYAVVNGFLYDVGNKEKLRQALQRAR
jgi:hypothetical protein